MSIQSPAPLYVGIDAGGTHAKLVAASTRGRRITLSGPAANLQRLGTAHVADVLTHLLLDVLARFPEHRLEGVAAGVAGAGRAADQDALRASLTAALGNQAPAHLIVTHDADIALQGAFGGESGVIVIAGTGSVVFGRTRDGALRRAGGWGYLLGDEGSGHALGRAALRAVADELDGGRTTALTALVRERLDLDGREAIIRFVYAAEGRLQDAAPLLLDAAAAGDAAAGALLARETRLLAEQAGHVVAEGAWTEQAALLGGLSQSGTYHRAFADALQARAPGWTLRPPATTALEGALQLARRAADG